MPDIEAQPEDAYPKALVEAACGGDRRAFGELFRALYPRVHRTAWAMLGSESEADDVAQQAFLKAWQHRAKFNFGSRYSTWLHRIAVNCALDALRRRRRWRDRFASLFAGGTDSVPSAFGPAEVRPGNPDPTHAAETAELGELIEAAVAQLPEAQRTVLVLREYEGYSYEEIARTLKIRPGTVMSRLFTARQKLQTLLSKEVE